jgi:hypothetical protein
MKIDTTLISRRDFLGGSLGVTGTILLSGCGASSGGSNLSPNSQRNNNFIEIKFEDNKRVVITNGYPKHSTGEFPNPTCPYGVGSEETFRFEMPKTPTLRVNSPESIYEKYHRFGVAINGVTFDPAGPAWDENNKWHVEVLSFNASRYLGIDSSNAHVQPYDREGGADEKYGEYHYHGFPEGLFKLLFKEDIEKQTAKKMFLLGYAADGYPVYAPQAPTDPFDENSQIVELSPSYRLKAGARQNIVGQSKRPAGTYDGTFVEDYEYIKGLGDLDEFNGREGWTPEHGNTYYYVITKTWPFIPRKFKGELLPPKEGNLTFETMNFVHPRPPGDDQIPEALKKYSSA